MTATRFAKASTLVALAVGWLVAAWLLTRTTVPGDLHAPHVDARSVFPADVLHRSARYDGFLRWLWVAATLVTLAALDAVRLPRPDGSRAPGSSGAWRPASWSARSRRSASGPSACRSARVELWWGRRYGLERSGYAEWAFEQWPALLAQVVGLTIALTVLLLLAGRFGRRWWLVAAPLFVVGGVVLVLVLPWLETLGTRPPHDTPAAARIRQLARDEGVGGTPVRIEEVHDQTTAANAMATGIGPSARVFIWDTFLDGRYSNREIEVVAAHEFGHIAHHHIWKGLAWSLLLTVPGFWLVERATRRRGGLERPEVVPFALLVLALIGLLITPLGNVVSRRYEAEADWSALRATRDPAAAASVFRKFSRDDLVQPNPPLWSYIWIDNHPTVVQRIAMARAYAARRR